MTKCFLSDKRVLRIPGGMLFDIYNKNEDMMAANEVYASKIERDTIRAWKRHRRMTCLLTVPVGCVEIVCVNEKEEAKKYVIGEENYKQVRIEPMQWYGFRGIDQKSTIISVVDMEYDESEIERLDIDQIEYDW